MKSSFVALNKAFDKITDVDSEVAKSHTSLSAHIYSIRLQFYTTMFNNITAIIEKKKNFFNESDKE